MSFINLLTALPPELWRFHLLCSIDEATRLVLSFTCSRVQQYCLEQKKGIIAHQEEIMRDLFRFGNLKLLEWFGKNLKYPVSDETALVKCLKYSAEGKPIFLNDGTWKYSPNQLFSFIFFTFLFLICVCIDNPPVLVGRLDLITALATDTIKSQDYGTIAASAIKTGDVSLIQYFHSQGIEKKKNHLYYQLSIWISSGWDCRYALSTACGFGHLPIVKFLLEKFPTHLHELLMRSAVTEAVSGGHLEVR